jgi:hypothetical protein
MELCRRRAVEHARADEDGDEDEFVHLAWRLNEALFGLGWFGGIGLVLGCSLGCVAGLDVGLGSWAAAAR